MSNYVKVSVIGYQPPPGDPAEDPQKIVEREIKFWQGAGQYPMTLTLMQLDIVSSLVLEIAAPDTLHEFGAPRGAREVAPRRLVRFEAINKVVVLLLVAADHSRLLGAGGLPG